MPSSSTSYQHSPTTYQANPISTYPTYSNINLLPHQSTPQAHPTIYSNISPQPQIHLQDYQAPSQQEHASPSYPLYQDQVSLSTPATFDKGNATLAYASYWYLPSSPNQMPIQEPTSPIPTPPCNPNPLVYQPSNP